MAIEVQFSDLEKLLNIEHVNMDARHKTVTNLGNLRDKLLESTLEVLDILQREHHIGATELAKEEVKRLFGSLSDEFITHTAECHNRIEGGALALWRIAISPNCPANIKAVILQVGYQAEGSRHAEQRENDRKGHGYSE